MPILIIIWIIVTAFLAFEYWILHNDPSSSLLYFLQKYGLLSRSFQVSSKPGDTLSLWLGWIGLSFMVAMNLYSVRKRTNLLKGMGSLQSWLNFHIFCGLIGPSFILFHCNFKVRGLVAISFWSMVVSFASGIIGRYIYVQLLHEEADLLKVEEKILKKINSVITKSKIQINDAERDYFLATARRRAGVYDDHENVNAFIAFARALMGSGRMLLQDAVISAHWPSEIRPLLNAYAINRRKIVFLVPFQILMGYWHTFHFPFAIFMYVAAAIHVAAALIFIV